MWPGCNLCRLATRVGHTGRDPGGSGGGGRRDTAPEPPSPPPANRRFSSLVHTGVDSEPAVNCNLLTYDGYETMYLVIYHLVYVIRVGKDKGAT